MYECEEQKQHEKDHPTELSLCGHCAFFIHEADKCLEDSIITPVYRTYWNPDSKPPHFKDDGTNGKLPSIIYVQGYRLTGSSDNPIIEKFEAEVSSESGNKKAKKCPSKTE